MAEIIWAPRALADLEALVAYISQNAPVTARRFAQKIIARVECLATNPLSGSLVDEDETCTYRQVLVGNYRVIYRVANDTVYVVAVHHAARLLEVRELD